MRVLYLAHRIPYPPNKGDKIRAFHEICGLTERGHEVHALAFADDPRDVPLVEELRRYCASATVVSLDTRAAKLRALMALAGAESLSLAYFRHPAMADQVAERVQGVRPDVCVVYSSPMVQYIPDHLRARTLVDLVDVDSEKWRDYAAAGSWPITTVYGVEGRRLRALELSIVERYGRTLLTTEREAALLRRELRPAAAERLSTLVNGVDLDYHRAQDVDISTLPGNERQFLEGGGPRVVFTGAMDYYANADGVSWFVREVWPRVRSAQPGARLLIVGAKPGRDVLALRRNPGVSVTGFVQDVRPYLWSADVCIAPLRIARGVQNKVLEACACSKPVVATVESVAGLPTEARDAVLTADVPGDFASNVNELIGDARRRRALGAAARAYVERHHSWRTVLDSFGHLVESVAVPAEV